MKERNFDKTITYHGNSPIPIKMRGSFDDDLKRGIYKELYRRKMISEGQLCILLKTRDVDGGAIYNLPVKSSI